MKILDSIFSGLLTSAVYDLDKGIISNCKSIEKRYEKAFERAVSRFYSDPGFAGNEARQHYTDYRMALQEASKQQDILNKKNGVYVELLSLFEEEVSKDIILGIYNIFYGVRRSQETIKTIDKKLSAAIQAAEYGQEKNSREHKEISEKIDSLKSQIEKSETSKDEDCQFDINIVERIHISNSDPFTDKSSTMEEKDIKWSEIIVALDPVLRKPHSENGLADCLIEYFPGILKDDVKRIIDKLHGYGLADVITSSTEFEGVSAGWFFSEKGRQAYERAMNYDKLPVFQERDKAQVIELLNSFSTFAMDDFLREGPDYLSDLIHLSAYGWRDIIHRSAFQIYNSSLSEVLYGFADPFIEITEYGECYIPVEGQGKNKLVRRVFGVINKDYEAKIQRIDDLFSKLPMVYHAFIEYIKSCYPEFDLRESSRRFEQEYGK